MPDREVVIKISAKNLTEAEFRKVKKGISGLGSSAKGTAKKTGGMQRAFSSFGKAAPGALKAVTIGAAAVVGAVVGITTAIVKLGERGAVVGDVKEAFDKLSASSGTTGAVMLGALAEGVKGTLTNFELMKVANKALGAGLLDSADDARTLAEGARLLAKRTGGDTAQAFETMTTAMASGRTAQLKQLGLFVDNKQAVEDYAKAQGKSVSQMNDADRAAALQVATLAALRSELANNAPPLADFGELIEQGKVAVKNLVDGLALMISKSPPLIAGMQAVRDIVGDAFGGDQSTLILTIVNLIERAALIVIEFAKSGVSATGFLYRSFQGIKLVVLSVVQGVVDLQHKFLDLVASTLEAAASVPMLADTFGNLAVNARVSADSVGDVNTRLKEEMVDTYNAAAGNSAFSESLEKVSGVLDTIKGRMVNAGMSQRELNAATAEGATGMGTLATAHEESSARINTALAEWAVKFNAELISTGDQTRQWAEDEKTFLQELAGEQGFGGLQTSVVGVGDVTAAQTAAMTAAFSSFGIQTTTDMAAMVEQLEKDFETIKKSGLATDKDLAESAKQLSDAKAELRGLELDNTMSMNDALLGSSMAMFSALGSKFKAAAIAGAIISTYMAIAKSLGAYPWPFNLVAAAAAGIAGFMNVAKIRSSEPGMRAGTAGLDYQDFGKQTAVALHGKEAVIPRGGGHQLAKEIAGALDRRGGGAPTDTGIMVERLERVGSKLDTLPRAIQRAVRDGVLLAAS